MGASQMGLTCNGRQYSQGACVLWRKGGMVAGEMVGKRHLPFEVMSEPQSTPLLLLV